MLWLESYHLISTPMIAIHILIDDEQPKPPPEDIVLPTGLKQSDQAIWRHFKELSQEGDVCRASIPKIARACRLSQRQVQISVGRLIEAGLIKRVAYDFGNADRAKRGSIYKLLR